LCNCESNVLSLPALSLVEVSNGIVCDKIIWFTYILKCSDNSFYVGSTDNIKQRIARHNAGRGPKWTALRLPVKLVYNETHKTEKQAMKRERQIKKWSQQKKEAIIAADFKALEDLSKSKG